MSFYFIVSTIAVVILIIALVGIGIAFNTPNNAEVFPTVQNQCPDYWEVDGSSNKCKIPGTGTLNAPTIPVDSNNQPINMNATNTPGLDNSSIDFTASGWSMGGNSSTCSKKKWADSYKIIWDGITNYNNC
jgi:hypothetical protein